MPSKKVIGGIIATLALISVVALIPIFMYGFNVNTTEVNLGMSMTGSTTSSSISVSSIGISQGGSSPSFSPNVTGIEIKEKTINAYEYIFSKANGVAEVSEHSGEAAEGASVDIYITFNLTTPSNKSLSFEFNPQDLNSEGLEVSILLGPDELAGETGTFHLKITISITITVPVVGTVVDMDLEPVNRDFTVPAT